MSQQLLQATQRLNKAACDLLTHAQLVESGHGETPLQNHVQTLAHPAIAGPGADGIAVALTGLSSNAVAKTLSLWLEADYFSCRALIPSRSACFEIEASPVRAWQLTAGGNTSRYDSLAALAADIETMEQAGTAPSLLSERPCIRVPAPEGCENLRLLVPSSLDALRNNAALASWLGDQARLVILTGHPDDAADQAALEALQPLVTAVGAFRPVILGGVGPEGRSGPPPWTRALSAPLTLQPLLLVERAGQALAGAESELPVIREVSRLRQMEGACLLLQDALASESVSLQNRRRRLDGGRAVAGPVATDGGPRSQMEKVLKPFLRDLEELRKNRDEQAAKALGADGALYQAAQRITEQTTFDKLRQENLSHSIRLTLGAGTLDELRTTLRQELTQNLRQDLTLIREAVDAGLESLRRSLSEKTRLQHPLRAPEADPDRFTDALSALIQLNVRYKGEIPRSTWKTRFQGARNWMMGISMFLMLSTGFGAVFGQELGKELRTILSVLMLFAFFGGLFAAIFGYKKLRDEAVAREMDKLADALMQELSRLLQSLMGEKRRLLGEHLQKIAREVEAEVGQIFQQQSDGQRSEIERNRQIDAEKVRILDNRLRALQQSQVGCRQVASELAQVHLLLSQAAAESVPRPAAAPAAKPAPPPSPPTPEPPRITRREPAALDSFVPPPAVTQNFS